MDVCSVLGSLSRVQVKLTSSNRRTKQSSCGVKLLLSPSGLCIDAGRGYVGMAAKTSTEFVLSKDNDDLKKSV